MSDKRSRAASGSRSSLPEVHTAAAPPSAAERAAATTVFPREDATSVAAIMDALPDPASLPEDTLVIVPGEVTAHGRSLARSVLAVFGRNKTVPRVRRCSALVARGYVDVGAGADENGADLAWGYAPCASG